MSRPPRKPPPPPPAARPRLGGRRLWLLRLLALVGAPVLFFGLLELVLRLAGYGYPTAFLLPSSNQGHDTFVQNDQFGWQFFGRRMARVPDPISIPRQKPAGTIRIFVFGESAAYGDPQPQFGLPRMLKALLELRHPGVRFEVVNAAMTAINSHVILPIARDCARAGGDVWVIYMGNNEVVGPFGAGTVFSPQTPPLPLIRASIDLKATRTGQLLDAMLSRLHHTAEDKTEWGGMMMFLNQQVRADDPRMARVYHNFQRNLRDIIRAGHDSGAGVVVSSVAVNLDCGPFGSQHRADLPEAARSRWDRLYQQGIDAQKAGDFSKAQSDFRSAAAIDDTVAELRFRLGQCALALGQAAEARGQLVAARDLDTLRFRCDSRLNELIRRTASDRQSGRILFADAAGAFAAESSNGIPGFKYFYEHVHLTFQGNYLLGLTIARQVEKLLPQKIAQAHHAWPDIGACARRLAWTDADRASAVSEILTRLTDPPFTAQADHDAQVQRLKLLARKLASATAPDALARDLHSCEQAVAAWPTDAALWGKLAFLKQTTGDLAGAQAAARRSVDLLPSSTEAWQQLGFVFVQEKKFQEAADAYRRAFGLDPQNVWSLQNLALCLQNLGRTDPAARVYRQALALEPRFGPAWLGLGQLLEARNHNDPEAQRCFQQALVHRVHRAPELAQLARFCQGRGWFEAAATNFEDAIEMNPADPVLRLEAGQCLAALGRHAQAARLFGQAAQLSTNWGQAYFLCGLELGRAGRPAEAAVQFRQAARLLPELIEPHLNLGIALSQLGSNDEALGQFEWVLQRHPTNALALHYVESLRRRTSAGVSPGTLEKSVDERSQSGAGEKHQ